MRIFLCLSVISLLEGFMVIFVSFSESVKGISQIVLNFGKKCVFGKQSQRK